MKEKIFLIDTTKCIGCRGCQVACKVWNNLDPEDTKNWGSYQNPGNMSGTTYTLVRFSEVIEDGKLRFLFSKDQCRHCAMPGCADACPVEGAIYQWKEAGAVFVTEKCDPSKCRKECLAGCPFEVMKFNEKANRAHKCRLCPERIVVGAVPACTKTCPTGALSFGDKDEMVKIAEQKLAEIKKIYPTAELYPGTDWHVIWLLTSKQEHYHLAEQNPTLFKKKEKMYHLAEIPLAYAIFGAAFLGGLSKLKERKKEIQSKKK